MLCVCMSRRGEMPLCVVWPSSSVGTRNGGVDTILTYIISVLFVHLEENTYGLDYKDQLQG